MLVIMNQRAVIRLFLFENSGIERFNDVFVYFKGIFLTFLQNLRWCFQEAAEVNVITFCLIK